MPRPGECGPWADRACSARSFIAMLVLLSIAGAIVRSPPRAPGARPAPWTLRLRGGGGDADAPARAAEGDAGPRRAATLSGALRPPGVMR